jgi:23S rRNA pseudouridine1911/1915/1917 synthase
MTASATNTAWLADQDGQTLAALIKAKTGEPWSIAKRFVEGGKVFVDGTMQMSVDFRLRAGQSVELRKHAARPMDPTKEGVLVFDDAHVVVIDKPCDVNSVPYEERETGTAMDLIRGTWRRQGIAATTIPLHIVHRIDRATSGLLMFAKSKRAEAGLAAQLRAHTCEREYLCVAQGVMPPQRIESMLVADRGDGIRGSARHANQGKRAVTHVTVVEALRGATLCSVRLETGKTHQIRIHLSEAGHPLLGEEVYDRDYINRGMPMVESPRLMLHAHTLGFEHPVTGKQMSFQAALPPDFLAVLRPLQHSQKVGPR